MPIYEYSCRACNAEFEALVRSSTTPTCPECRSEDLQRVPSFSSVRSDATRSVVGKETSRRDAAQARDRVFEQAKYERNHD